jgi:hypothetical protein
MYLDGYICSLTDPDRPDIRIVDQTKTFAFHPDKPNPNNHFLGVSPLYSSGNVTLTGEDGSTWNLELTPTPNLAPWAYSGAGYSGGYNDGRGLGAYRGPFLEEYDEYDLSDLQRPINPETGEEVLAGHREQSVDLTLNGEVSGHGHTWLFTRTEEHAQS